MQPESVAAATKSMIDRTTVDFFMVIFLSFAVVMQAVTG